MNKRLFIIHGDPSLLLVETQVVKRLPTSDRGTKDGRGVLSTFGGRREWSHLPETERIIWIPHKWSHLSITLQMSDPLP